MSIGQGDSILVHSKGLVGLIDTGPGSKVSETISQYLPILITKLDFVLLTHFDQDHIEGFIRLADSYQIDKLFITKSFKDNYLITKIKNIIQHKKIKTYNLNSNNDFKFGEFEVNVIWPNKNTYQEKLDSNDLSIALEIKEDKCNVYTAGDLSSKYETESSKYILDNNFEVLKAGHHGSRTSSSEEFLSLINPDIAVISAGENNKYGHPHKEVLDVFNRNNIHIFQTKENDIIAYFDNLNQIVLKQNKKSIKLECF